MHDAYKGINISSLAFILLDYECLLLLFTNLPENHLTPLIILPHLLEQESRIRLEELWYSVLPLIFISTEFYKQMSPQKIVVKLIKLTLGRHFKWCYA